MKLLAGHAIDLSSLKVPVRSLESPFSGLRFGVGTQFHADEGGGGSAPLTRGGAMSKETPVAALRRVLSSQQDVYGRLIAAHTYEFGEGKSSRECLRVAIHRMDFALVRTIVEEGRLIVKNVGEFEIRPQMRAAYSHPLTQQNREPAYKNRIVFRAAEGLRRVVNAKGPEATIAELRSFGSDQFNQRLALEFPTLSATAIAKLASGYMQAVVSLLGEGKRVAYKGSGFGTFTVVDIKQREFKHPVTGEALSSRYQKRVRFAASRAFRDLVDEVQACREQFKTPSPEFQSSMAAQGIGSVEHAVKRYLQEYRNALQSK